LFIRREYHDERDWHDRAKQNGAQSDPAIARQSFSSGGADCMAFEAR